MVKKGLLLLSIVLLFTTNTRAQWNLIWSDEFDSTGTLDNTKWKFETGPNWYNGELQYYSDRIENARAENGNLVIEAIQESYGGKNYTSARVNSKVGWKYGRFEIKARLTNGTSLWPAIWMFPDAEIYGGWPKSGEIDIMENWSWAHNDIFGTIHCESYYHVKHTEKQGVYTVSDPAVNFHVYTIEWYEDQIRWFIDDVLYFSFFSEGTRTTYPFDHPFHFIFNVAIEGTAPGNEATWTKRTMEIDYVRVYSGPTTGPVMPVGTIPAKIEAEHFINVQGIRTENCNEGGRNLCYVDAGDWVEYKINVQTAGKYIVDLRVACPNSSGELNILSDNTNIGHIKVPNTYSWQTWKTIQVPVTLNAGEQIIRIACVNGFNLNWFEINEDDGTYIKTDESSNIQLFPNPANDNITIFGLQSNKEWNISLFDTLGKQVKETKTNKNQVNIAINDLVSGTYIARISNASSMINTLFIKQ